MADDVVWVPVLPSLRDFDRELGTKGAEAGKRAGELTAKAMADAVAKGQASVEKAVSAVEKARNREADAAGRVRVAQAELNKMLDAGEQDTVKLTRAQEKLEAAERKLGEAKSATKSKSKDLSNAEKDLETKTKDAARAAEEQGRAVRVSSGDMDKAEKSAGKLGNTVSGLGSKLKSYGMIAAGVAGLGGIGTILTKGLDRLTAIDNAKAKLSGLGHEAASIDQIMQNAMDAVKGTAFGLGDAAGIAAGAVAAGIAPGKDLERTLKLVGDAASIAGVGMGDMGAIFNKVAASNKIQGDVIAQLSDAGIPIVQLLGKELNKTAAEVLDMASKGEIGFDTFQNAMEKGMGGAALKAGNTFKGAVDNAGAALGRLGATILDAPFKAAPGIIGNITDSIDKLNTKTKGVLEVLTTGDYGEAFKKAFPNMDEDSRLVNFLFDVREGFKTAADVAMLFFGAVRGTGADVALPPELMNSVIDFGAQVSGWGDRLGAIFIQVRDGATDLVAPIGTIIGSLGQASAAIGFSAWELFLTVLEALTPIIVGTIVPAVETLARLMDENQWAVTGLVAAYTVYRTTMMAAAGASKVHELWTKRSLITTKAHEVATKASTIATRAWGIAQTVASAASKGAAVGVRALNAAIKANPIMAIVGVITLLVGALTWFFTKTELGKKIWEKVWSGIQSALSAAWEFIRPIFEAIGAIFTWLYDNIVQPIFTGLKIAFAIVATAALLLWQAFQSYLTMIAGIMTWLWQTVAQPIWALMQVGLQALGAFFGWVWSSLIKPAWDGLGAGISWVWNSIVLPVWNAMQAALNGLGAFFGWVWNSLIKPAWDGLGAGISWVWENVIRPAWDGLKGALQAIGDFFGWVWNTLIKPVWDALGSGINWVWENVIKRAFDGITSGLGIVRDAFDKAVGFIEQVWDKVRGAVAKPIKFVIDSVYNNGIRAAWNKVAGFVGLDELPEYKPEWLGAYASGTSVLPGYSPGRDNMRFVSTDGRAAIDLAGGEGIIRPEVTAALGTHWVDGVNAAAARGGRSGVARYLGGFAGGGVVENLTALVQENFPMMSITDTYRPGAADHHGSGLAIDFSNGYDSTPEMRGAAQWFHDNFGPQLLELIHSPFDGNIKNGQDVGDGFGYYGADIMAQHRNHVHVAAADPLGEPGGSGGSWLSRAWGAVKRGLRAMVERLFDGVMDPIGNAIPDFGGSAIGQFPRKVFDTLKDKAKEFLLGKADEQDSSSGGSVAPGAGPVADQVREAMAAYGWDSGPQWDAVDWIIGRESSWNPNARNASSGAFGLAQFLGGTKDQYLPDENPNPKVQGDAMARYIRDRYGDPVAAKSFWEANGWYDRGGLAVGEGLMAKATLKPERVLSPAETAAWEALVPHLVDVEAAMEMFNGLVAELDTAMGKVPGAALEEQGRDALDFFGLGKWGDLLFTEPQTATVEVTPTAEGLTDPAAADTVTESDRVDSPPPAAESGPRGPIVSIENALAFDLQELVEEITREVRHVILSDGMNGGWPT